MNGVHRVVGCLPIQVQLLGHVQNDGGYCTLVRVHAVSPS